MSIHQHTAAPTPRTALNIVLTVMLCLAQFSSCRDPAAAEGAGSVATMRLTVGTQVVEVSRSGQVTGGPVVIALGTSEYRAELLESDGLELRRPSSYRLDVTSSDGNTITVSESGGYTGTVRGVRRGQSTITFTLWTRYEDCQGWARDASDFEVDVLMTVQ